MNLRLLWQAWKLTVVIGGVIFVIGLIFQRDDILSAPFNPFVFITLYLVSFAGCCYWNGRRSKR